MSLYEKVRKKCAGNFSMVGIKDTVRLVCNEVENLVNEKIASWVDTASNIRYASNLRINDSIKRLANLEEMYKSNTKKTEVLQSKFKELKANQHDHYQTEKCKTYTTNVLKHGPETKPKCFNGSFSVGSIVWNHCKFCFQKEICQASPLTYPKSRPESKNPDVEYLDKKNKQEFHIHIPEGNSVEVVGKLMVSNPANLFNTEYIDRLTDNLPDCFGAKNCGRSSLCIYDRLCGKTSRSDPRV